MSFILRDCETKERIEFPDDTVCACCGRTHNPSKKVERLVIDHDRWVVPMVTRILCFHCNIKKGNKTYASFYPNMWVPGMPVGERVPIPQKPVERTYTEYGRRVSNSMLAWWKKRKAREAS
jgi:hypothetical protein